MLINTVNIGIRGRQIYGIFPKTIFKEVLNPTETFTAGNYVSSEKPMPQNLSLGKYDVNRGNWPDTGSPIITTIIEVSVDNGVTWPHNFGCSSLGGTYIRGRDGSVATKSSIIFDLPEPSNPNRKVRVKKFVITGITLSDSLEVF